jgi:hypothetical protein
MCNIKQVICIGFHEVVIFMTRAVQYGVSHTLARMQYFTNHVGVESTNAVSSLLHNRALIFSRSNTYIIHSYIHNRSLLLWRGLRAIVSTNLCSYLIFAKQLAEVRFRMR